MRKNAARFIKSYDIFHRTRGTFSVNLPAGTCDECIRDIKILGATGGVGDLNEESLTYDLTFKILTRNLLSGEEFTNAYIESGAGAIGQIVNNYYTFSPIKDKNGTKIIDSRHIHFKDNTVYSFCANFHFNSASASRTLPFRFNYSDGTYSPLVSTLIGTDGYDCIKSDSGKTVVSISSRTESGESIRIELSSFGIFEGAYENYQSAFEAFDGESMTLCLDRPLQRIDFSKDEANLKTKEIKRKVFTLFFDGNTEAYATEKNGVFMLKLPFALKRGKSFASDYAKVSKERLSLVNYSFAEADDDAYVLFKAGGKISKVSELLEMLNKSPVKFSYVLKEPITEKIDITIPYRDGGTVMELFTEVAPSDFYADFTNST